MNHSNVQTIELYHGSDQGIFLPDLCLSHPHNDFGPGFYCTEDGELGREWACKEGEVGILNQYELEIDGLSMLDLTDGTHSLLEWITLLITYRTFSVHGPFARQGKEFLMDRHFCSIEGFDLIKGYRADDSYFAFAAAFLNNQLSLRGLEEAMHLGNLGVQWVLKSDHAMERIHLLETERVDEVYITKFHQRDQHARSLYRKLLENIELRAEDLFLRDIMEEERGK